jgi:hypothetical protein
MRLVGLLVIGLAFFPMENLVVAFNWEQPLRAQGTRAARLDYSKFAHSTHVTKEKMSCDSCHKFPTRNWSQVRQGEAAFPDVAEFPDHATCLNCHRQQFFARERPQPVICSNCHVNVTPRDTARFLFPSLGDVSNAQTPKTDLTREFAVYFPHDKHLDALALHKPTPKPEVKFVTASWQKPTGDSSDQKTCPICHQTYLPQGDSDEEYVTKPPSNLGDNFWLKKGTFKTIPTSHAACFGCHNVEVGITPAPSDCNACHKLNIEPVASTDFDANLASRIGVSDKRMLMGWERRVSSGAFRHEGGEHPNISCTRCHTVPTMNTLNVKTLSVSVRTCGGAEGCHVTATLDDGGILNYEIDKRKTNPGFVCTKCHVGFGKRAIPESHEQAIQALKKEK